MQKGTCVGQQLNIKNTFSHAAALQRVYCADATKLSISTKIEQ